MTGTIPAGPGQGPIPDPIQAGLARGWKVIDGAHQGAAADRGHPQLSICAVTARPAG